jgi:NitT/TauT family transport system ATP-binding protein
MTASISIRGVRKSYVGRGREMLALDRVDLDIAPGAFVAFVGPSGCGKSTLLNMVAGILPTEEGVILHDGSPVRGINRAVGYMTQQDAVLPWRTAEQNVDLPLRLHGIPARARRGRVAEMLEAVGLGGFERAYPAELSGGMRKRVALAQLLAYGPHTLLMDEPFGALDAQLKLLMQEQLLRIWQERGQTVIFVTHDLAEAITLAQRVVVFSGRPGRVKQIEDIDLPATRDVFRVRFLPAFELAYLRLWDALSPEIRRGEEASEIRRGAEASEIRRREEASETRRGEAA